jgi:hypothetical protein
MWAGCSTAKLIELPLGQGRVPYAAAAEQRAEGNPRFREAHAVASYLERKGIAPLTA